MASDHDKGISRRGFLRAGGLAIAGAGFAPALAGAGAGADPGGSKRLIVIYQRGAVDGLSMVVPHAEPEYYRRRPTIALACPGDGADASLDLDGFFGFHPRLAPLLPLYRSGRLAVVHACGSPHPTRSHLDAQEYMESGTPGVDGTIDTWVDRARHSTSASGAEIAVTSIGGWDHHLRQGAARGALATALDELGRRLSALVDELGDRIDDTVIVTLSEFGRSVSENADGGTDHGHGNVMLVIGGNVNGGQVHGKWPGLSESQLHEGRDLAVTTDFRDVLSVIAVTHLGIQDVRSIFPGHPNGARNALRLFSG